MTCDPTPLSTRPRLLLTAYHFDRAYSMESRLAWQRARSAAREYDVTVICARPPIEMESRRVATENSDAVQGVEMRWLPLNRLERSLMKLPGLYYVGYRLWHRRAYRLARRLDSARPFALVHHVSFCGYREPGDAWRLGAPFVWGPVGGTQKFPRAFLGELGWLDAVREVLRNLANSAQLRFDRRFRRAAASAAQVLAANQSVAADLERCAGIRSLVQLETGVETSQRPPRPRRDAKLPLRILWAGRLQPWKGLPLLLKGLAALPSDIRYQLRVLGQGPCEPQWRRLAERLGVAQHIEWVGWPAYEGQLPHYDWADVFAFTSLRDTSGTGLLEALAAGAPIIGLNHQGAADVMTARCAIPVDAASPAATIEGFRATIARLASDPELLAQLSIGARQRARDFDWETLWESMRQVYAQAERRPQHIPEQSAASPPAQDPAPGILQLVEAFS